jgi:hypothetical protein
MTALPEKLCSACRITKPVHEFGKRSASQDGLNYKCRSCNAEYLASWRARNPDAFKVWSADRKDLLSDRFKEWRAANKERRSQYMAEWTEKNRPLVRASQAKRNAARRRATPAWADQRAILDVYRRANEMTHETGIPHEVDHIYPLQGKTVCGLHCAENLQVLTQFDNISKLNRMPEEWRPACRGGRDA